MSGKESDSFKLVDAASDLFGALAGVAMTVVHQDIRGLFEGAIVGTGVAHSLKYTANEFLGHVMGKREQQRVGLVYGLTIVAIRKPGRRSAQQSITVGAGASAFRVLKGLTGFGVIGSRLLKILHHVRLAAAKSSTGHTG